MNTDHLIHMANRIGEFFQAMPDTAEAKAGIASHLHKFWAPGMRRQLTNHVADQGGAGLSPLVLQAVREHQAELA